MQNFSAFCGLYCAACPMYIETQKGTPVEIENIGPVRCNGCRSGIVPPWCNDCGIKNCARNKKIDFCSQCEDFPCEQMENFKNDKTYPYHTEVYDNLRIIKEEGEENWITQMKQRWFCSDCGEIKSWFEVECKKCGKKLNGYQRQI